MPRDYLLRHPEFEDLIRIVAGKIGIDPALIEKDGIMHCLYGLQRLGYKFELKGGTSLFKGFKFIRARRRWALLLRRSAMMRQSQRKFGGVTRGVVIQFCQSAVNGPMMDWRESSIFSISWKAACARCVHRAIKENQKGR
jgi:hypothetical protein